MAWIKTGGLVECQVGDWTAAQVIQVSSARNEVLLTFLEPAASDEWIPCTSQRLRPPGIMTWCMLEELRQDRIAHEAEIARLRQLGCLQSQRLTQQRDVVKQGMEAKLKLVSANHEHERARHIQEQARRDREAKVKAGQQLAAARARLKALQQRAVAAQEQADMWKARFHKEEQVSNGLVDQNEELRGRLKRLEAARRGEVRRQQNEARHAAEELQRLSRVYLDTKRAQEHAVEELRALKTQGNVAAANAAPAVEFRRQGATALALIPSSTSWVPRQHEARLAEPSFAPSPAPVRLGVPQLRLRGRLVPVQREIRGMGSGRVWRARVSCRNLPAAHTKETDAWVIYVLGAGGTMEGSEDSSDEGPVVVCTSEMWTGRDMRSPTFRRELRVWSDGTGQDVRLVLCSVRSGEARVAAVVLVKTSPIDRHSAIEIPLVNPMDSDWGPALSQSKATLRLERV